VLILSADFYQSPTRHHAGGAPNDLVYYSLLVSICQRS